MAPPHDAAAHAQRDAGAARRAPHHPNGWWRDTAQQLLVLKQDKSVVPALQTHGASRHDQLRALPRAVDARRPRRARHVARARRDAGSESANAHPGDPRQRDAVQGRRHDRSPPTTAPLTKDATPDVAIQAMMTLNTLKVPDAAAASRRHATRNKRAGRAARRRHDPQSAGRRAAGGGGLEALAAPSHRPSRPFSTRVSAIYKEAVLRLPRRRRPRRADAGRRARHDAAPALAGSPRVTGHRTT